MPFIFPPEPAITVPVAGSNDSIAAKRLLDQTAAREGGNAPSTRPHFGF